MQRNSTAGDEQRRCTTAKGMMMLLRREREMEVVAQLHELLFPSPVPCGGGGASWSSSATLNVAECRPSDESSPVYCGGGRRRRPGCKRVREDEQGRREEVQEQHGGGGASVKTRCRRKKKKQGTTTTSTLVTTVPDFDGYQWRKYGQKQIEASRYPRSYYRCTNSTDQGCPAKRMVQRNDDGNSGGPPKYTVVYISEHTCKATESAPPVILETTVVRTKNPAADGNTAAPAAAPDVIAAVVPAAPDVIAAVVPAAESSSTSTGTPSPAISDITWIGGDDPTPSVSEHGYYSLVFAGEDYWDRTTAAPAAAAVLEEMDFAGPIRSPVHIAADGWIDGLFVNEPSVLNSCHLFGF